MMTWPRFQPAAPIEDVLDVRFHRGDCAITRDCDFCTCGAVLKLALAEGLYCGLNATGVGQNRDAKEDL